ncbi:MAG: PEP-CTERM sorting domain-containing protein [Accumulibacter sp.]|jgi:hypothetical protein
MNVRLRNVPAGTLLRHAVAVSSLVAAMTASASPITYNVNLAIGPNTGTAVGTITTDGTIGVLAAKNVLSFSITLDPDPGSAFVINEGNAEIGDYQGLIATLSDLSFNFSGSDSWLMQNPNVGSAGNYLCFTGAALCGGSSQTSANAITMGTDVVGVNASPMQGRQVVATATSVPEPSSVALAALGLIAAGVGTRRRRA